MAKWIEGSDLLRPSGKLRDYQLLELVKQGLQPYDKAKRLLEPGCLAERLTENHDFFSGPTIGVYDVLIDPVVAPVIGPVKPVAVPGIDPGIDPVKPRKIRIVSRTMEEYLRDIVETAGPDDIKIIMEELTGALYREEEVRRFLGTDITEDGSSEPSDTQYLKKKLTRNQRHRKEARRLAGNRWEKDKNKPRSLSEMVKCIQSLSRNPFDGTEYKDRAIEDWIRDLNPAYTPRCPGRKRKTPAE